MPRLVANSDGSVDVMDGQNRLSKFHAPTTAPPDDAGAATTGDDAERAMQIAKAVTVKVRAMMPLGPFNNEMSDKGETKYVNDFPKKYNTWVDDIFYDLGKFEAEPPPSFVYQMAALCRAATEVGGGVCSMLAHVGMGQLTLLGEARMKACLVVDQNFDHSYCVVSVGDSTWYTVDPWVGKPHVVPWADGYFPKADVSRTFAVDFYGSAAIPYGVAFDDLEVQRSVQRAKTKAEPGVREMDGHYVHDSNVESEKSARYEPIMMPFEWGDGVGRKGAKGSPYDIFG